MRKVKMFSGRLRFDHDIVSGAVLVWACLSVACDTCIDEAWIDFMDAFEVHAILLQRTWEIVLHQHIAILGESMQDVYP